MAPLHPYRSVARLAHCLECTLLRPAVPLSHRPTSHNPLPSRNCRLTHTAATPSFWRCDTDDAARFRDDGFIVARGLLSAEENELVRSALEGDKTLTENEIVLNDDAKAFTKSERVLGTAEQLLGRKAVHYHSKQLLKHPQAGGMWNWHQDYGYWYKDYFLTPEMLTCYLAVDAQSASLQNGALKLLRGSHAMGRLDHWSKGDQQGADLERVEMARKRYEEVTVDLAPGDAVFFSCLTLHASPGNFSERRRLAFASCFTAATNVQYRDAYIPCVECTVVPDAALMQTMGADGTPTLTDAEDKIMLAPDEGVERARKDSQN